MEINLSDGLRKLEDEGYQRIEERRKSGLLAPAYNSLSPEERLYVKGVSRSFREGEIMDRDFEGIPTGCLFGICALVLTCTIITSPLWGPVRAYEYLQEKYKERKELAR